MTSFPAVVDSAHADGDLVFHLNGGSGEIGFGRYISPLGDVNGDGKDDLAIYSWNSEFVWTGRLGPYEAESSLGRTFPFDHDAPEVPGHITFLDTQCVWIGDINGDGFDDFDHHVYFETVGAYQYGDDSWVEWKLHDYAEIRYGGGSRVASGVRFGDQGREAIDTSILAGVGDINGDGFDDVSVSIDGSFIGGDRLKIVFGSASGIPANTNKDAAPSLSFTGASVGVIGSVGDFNGDGIGDLVVGAFRAGGSDSYVIFGGAGLGAGTFDVTTLDGVNGFKLADGSATPIGDINGDGRDDLVVAMSGRTDGDPLYVVYGRADSPAVFDASSVDGTNGFRILGASGTVSAAGDINGDGLGDMIVGADTVVFGRTGIGAEGIDVGQMADGDNGFRVIATGVEADAWGILAVGDINGDGFDDLADAVHGENSVYFILGHAGTMVNGVGTGAWDHLTGSLYDDILNGANGNDLLRGLDGDDLLIGGAGGDTLSGGEGIDTASFAAGSHGVVVDLVAGTASGRGLGNDTLISIESVIGSAGDDDIAGTDGDNRIDGNLGADRMAGRLGDDSYVVDNAGDVVVEGRNQGHDAVETSLADYVLAPHVEDLTFVGSGDFRGTGNTLANVILGGAGNDVLNGSLGGDTLRGGAGDDLYIVDQGGDIVEESADNGFDTVQTRWSYTLTDHVEALVLRGTAGASGTGNDLANALTGNGAANVLSGLGGDDALSGKAGADRLLGGDGNDRLDGGSGDDVLRGGLGDDIYVVDSLGDQLSEANGGGLDTVLTSLSFTLASGFENLTIFTSQAVDGTGNSAANVLIGGSGANVLAGLRGSDTLTGAGGADIFVFGTGFGQDRITDFASNDVIKFENGLFADLADVKAHATQVGDDIVIAWSAGNTITIDDYLLEKLNAGDFLFA